LGHRHPLVKAVIGVVLVLLIGTVGYRLIEGWPLLDGFYMTVITITTIGFTEVHELNRVGKIFTLFIIFTGIGMVGYALVAGTKLVIEGEINKIVTRRRSMKAIEKLKDHFIICGYGRMGSFVCEQLHARGIPFVVVENKVEVQDKVVQAGHYLSPGDATEEDVLLAASIKTARGLVSVLNSDAANVYVVLTARELNPPLEIIARAAEESAQSRLLRAGATRVISPYQIGGMRMVMGIVKPTVMDFLQVAFDHKKMDVDLAEVRVAENSIYGGKKLIDTDLRRELNLIIIAIKKSDGRMEFNPGPNTVIQDNDTLIAMGKRKDLEVFENKAGVRS
jgi:voltage-gated potassium channel